MGGLLGSGYRAFLLGGLLGSPGPLQVRVQLSDRFGGPFPTGTRESPSEISPGPPGYLRRPPRRIRPAQGAGGVHISGLRLDDWLEFLSPRFFRHRHTYPRYSRPRIVGPASFRREIANSVHGPQFLAPGGSCTPPRRSPTRPPTAEYVGACSTRRREPTASWPWCRPRHRPDWLASGGKVAKIRRGPSAFPRCGGFRRQG